MGAFRVIQISDTHLSGHRSWFVPKFHAVVRIIASLQPDLVLNTGDGGLDALLRAIPGHHDVGGNPWQPGRAQSRG
jgi:predicted MPP superfamily phosphohydrolase